MLARDLALLVVGGLLLHFGAAWLVRGAAGIAIRLRVRPLLVGLTVVAYGTSTPELVVGVSAALSGRGAIAFGNAVGSNITNLGLILGLTSVISPPRADASLLRRELPVMAASALVVPLLLLDDRLGRIEGAGLLVAATVYTWLTVRSARSAPEESAEVAAEVEVAGGAPPARSLARLALLVVIGISLLLLGGNWLVDGASALARAAGVSERVVGLTVVAFGTSLPELATSVVAARRGHSDIAIGNVVGSNIFNVLLILGASGVAGPLDVRLGDVRLDLGVLVLVTLVAAVFLRGDRKISRPEGALLLAIYGVFVAMAAAAARR